MDKAYPGGYEAFKKAADVVEGECEFCGRRIDPEAEDYLVGMTGHWAHDRCLRRETEER